MVHRQQELLLSNKETNLKKLLSLILVLFVFSIISCGTVIQPRDFEAETVLQNTF